MNTVKKKNLGDPYINWSLNSLKAAWEPRQKMGNLYFSLV